MNNNNVTNYNERTKRVIYLNHKRKMQKVRNIVSVVLGCVLALVLFSTLLISESAIKSTYQRDALVIYVSDEFNTAVTIDGNEWDFVGDGFEVDDEIRLTFNNNQTEDNIYDDEIIEAKVITIK